MKYLSEDLMQEMGRNTRAGGALRALSSGDLIQLPPAEYPVELLDRDNRQTYPERGIVSGQISGIANMQNYSARWLKP